MPLLPCGVLTLRSPALLLPLLTLGLLLLLLGAPRLPVRNIGWGLGLGFSGSAGTVLPFFFSSPNPTMSAPNG